MVVTQAYTYARLINSLKYLGTLKTDAFYFCKWHLLIYFATPHSAWNPWLGVKSVPPELAGWSLKLWTTKEVPKVDFYKALFLGSGLGKACRSLMLYCNSPHAIFSQSVFWFLSHAKTWISMRLTLQDHPHLAQWLILSGHSRSICLMKSC